MHAGGPMYDCGLAFGLSCNAISVVVLGHARTTVPAQRRAIGLCTWPHSTASMFENERSSASSDPPSMHRYSSRCEMPETNSG